VLVHDVDEVPTYAHAIGLFATGSPHDIDPLGIDPAHVNEHAMDGTVAFGQEAHQFV
jgi:hypothetical protein